MPTAYKQKKASTLELAMAAITLVAIIKQKRTVLMHCANSGIERKQRACEALGGDSVSSAPLISRDSCFCHLRHGWNIF
jgi:hypothetical protein